VEGTYLVLLRVEAADDREGDSDLGAAGGGSGIVHSGGVAGFPMPVLRYVVAGEGGPARDAIGRLAAVGPQDGGSARLDSSFTITWRSDRRAFFYRLEIETDDGSPLLRALVPGTARAYHAPSLVFSRAGTATVRWRIAALDGDGRLAGRTSWRRVRLSATLGRPASPP
jgi:hypothetical protein